MSIMTHSTICATCLRTVEQEGGLAIRHTSLETSNHCPGSGQVVLSSYSSEEPNGYNKPKPRVPKPKESKKAAPRVHNPNFFNREPDGTVRLRVRFENEEASLFEEAAGETPVMVWLHRTLEAAAKRQVRAQRRNRPKVAPPLNDE